MCRWQNTVVPSGVTNAGGSTVRQTSITSGQRVWKRQPGGGAAGDGMSPCEDDPLPPTLPHRVRERDRRQERLGVGVLRAPVHLVGRTLLDDPPEVHHRDPVAHVAHEREVVRDEEVREPELLLEVAQQVDDIGLDRDVEAAHRLVEHEELGRQRERAGDRHPLELTARELARVPVAVLGAQPHRAQQLGRCARSGPCASRSR